MVVSLWVFHHFYNVCRHPKLSIYFLLFVIQIECVPKKKPELVRGNSETITTSSLLVINPYLQVS